MPVRGAHVHQLLTMIFQHEMKKPRLPCHFFRGSEGVDQCKGFCIASTALPTGAQDAVTCSSTPRNCCDGKALESCLTGTFDPRVGIQDDRCLTR